MARGTRESGYALLLVFLMAALLAIALYSQIPRVAFQSQRQKEQLLMTRGLQYIRGIQMFRQAFPGQPLTRMEDLETFQSRHFVRHKYVDPMTGKAEWRVIHMQNGVLTDSAVTKPTDPNGQQQTSQNYFIMPTAGVGGVDPQGQTGARPQDRRRASETPGGPGTGQLPPIPGPVSDGGTPAAGAQTNPGGQPGTDLTTQPNNPQNTQAPTTTGVLPGGGPAPQPGGNSPVLPGTNPATALIGQLLTQPRPGPAGAAAAMSAANGIVGIASKAELEGIMVYNDRTAYNEWEFIADPTRMPMAPAVGGGAAMNSPMAPNSPMGPNSQPGQPSIMQNPPGRGGGGNVAAGMQSLFGSAGQRQGQSATPTGTPGMPGVGAPAAGGGVPLGYRPGRP